MKATERNTRIYLKDRFGENNTICVSDIRNFEKTQLAECYYKYGQQYGHEDAQDYSVFNSTCTDLIKECLKELNKTFGTNFNDMYEARDNYQEWIEKWDEENGNYEIVKAYTYWDGNNWQTIIIEGDNFDDCVTHEIIEDEEVINELDEALENMKEESDEYGVKKYKYNDYIINESRFSNAWEEYSIDVENL